MSLTEAQKKQKEKQIKWWRDREAENLKKNLKTEEEYIDYIIDCYDYMMNQIQKEINGFYTKYAKAEGISMAEAKKRVSELDIKAYERKAARYVKNKDFSAEANAEMRLYNATMKINRLEMLKANIGLELVDGFNDLQKYFDEILTERTMDEFKRQAGILGKTIHNNSKSAHSIVNASFHNAKFSDRIWMYQDMLKAELERLLQIGLIQGKNPRELARHLEKLFGVSKSNAERLMRTELARVQGDAQLRSLKENGYEQYTFLALGSACDICKEIDGDHYYIDEAEIGLNMYPMHPNCRCAIAGYMDRKEYEEKIEYLLNGGDRNEWDRLKKKNKIVEKTSRNGTIKLTKMLPINLQFFASKEKQYGKKIGKHAMDYGLDPSNAEDRKKMNDIIDVIVKDYDMIKTGKWRGQDKEVDFYIKGEDVVICTDTKEFITILKGGISNERIKNARVKKIH